MYVYDKNIRQKLEIEVIAGLDGFSPSLSLFNRDELKSDGCIVHVCT